MGFGSSTETGVVDDDPEGQYHFGQVGFGVEDVVGFALGSNLSHLHLSGDVDAPAEPHPHLSGAFLTF